MEVSPQRIHLRLNWNGDKPHKSFEAIDDAIRYAREHSDGCYEVLNPDAPVRPYGDWDENLAESITHQEFEIRKKASVDRLLAIHPDVALADASSFPKRKISFHWTIPTQVVDSTAHAKQFVAGLGLPHVDYSVYSRRRKYRCVFTSKPNEHRPLMPFNCTPADTFVQYIPDTAVKVAVELPLKKVASNLPPPPPPDTPRPIESDQTIFTVAELLKSSRWDDYTECRNLIWALCDGGANRSVIHHYCKKSSKYSEAWVDSIIAQYNPNRLDRITFGSLRWRAKQDDPIGLDKFDGLTMSVSVDEITQLTTDSTTLFNWRTPQGYLNILPKHPTIAAKSALETGKTWVMLREIANTPFNSPKSVLILSPRITLTAMFRGVLDSRFVYYDTIRDKKTPITAPFLVMSAMSLHRLGKTDYEYVFSDECETLLAAMTPNVTHHGNYLANTQKLEEITRNATNIRFMDAFLTDRTIEFLSALRPSVQIVVNPYQPHKRTALLFNETQGGENGYLEHFYNQVSAGKKIYATWGTKNNAHANQQILERRGISSVLYTKDTDQAEKDRHCADVNTHWAKYQLVMSTSTITVGLNYTAEPSFDVCAFQTSLWGCLPRDVAQAIHRARKLKDDHYIGFIQSVADYRMATLNAGLDEMERYANQDTISRSRFLKAVGEEPTDYERLPNWLLRLLLRNQNEYVTSHKYPAAIMEHYLKECGVAFKYTTAKPSLFKKNDEVVGGDGVDYDDVPLICDEEADELMRNRFSTEMTIMDQMKISKYMLSKKVPPNKIDGNILMKWRVTPELVNNAYNEVHSTPAELLRMMNAKNTKKVLDLVSHEIQQLAIMQSWGFDYAEGFCIPAHDVPKADLTCFGIRDRSHKDTADQYCRNVVKAVKMFNGTTMGVAIQKSRKGDQAFLTYQPNPSHIVHYIQPKVSISVILNSE